MSLNFLQSLRTAFRAAGSRGRRKPANTYRPRLEALEDRLLPTTFPVTSLADSGAGSLRQAIFDANALAGDDTIDIRVTGTINLASALPGLSTNMDIQGPGANLLTVRRNTADFYRVFTVSGSPTVRISGLTVSNGLAWNDIGGGIYVAGGTFTLVGSVVSGNLATGGSLIPDAAVGGGIYVAGGTVTLVGSVLSGNRALGWSAGVYNGSPAMGGGLYVAGGTVTVTGSTLFDNQAAGGPGSENWGFSTSGGPGLGGGLYVAGGSVMVTNSTLSSNAASGGSGAHGGADGGHAGDGGYGEGGGLYVASGSVIVGNSTLSFNGAFGGSGGSAGATFQGGRGGDALGGGVSLGAGSLDITHSTLTANRAEGGFGGSGYFEPMPGVGLAGGLYTGGNVPRTRNTILAGNTASNWAPDLEFNLGSLGHNLIGNTSGGSGFHATDLLNVNPLLGPLQNNGGPTFTHALLIGSPAINAGDNTGAPATDQRGSGFARIVGGRIDIGAFEVQPPLPSEPTLVINDATVTEGDAGTVSATFTVSLSAATTQTVTVNYATANGSGTAGSDYAAASGTLTFAPGEISKTITVLVNGDTLNETDETFFVNLSAAANAVITDSQGVGTIRDDDAAPSLTINDVSRLEGNSGVTTFVFTVSLSAASGQTVTVNFATADGTAKLSDNDYLATSGTLTFAPGETTKTITVSVKGDRKREANQSFFLNLSGVVNATILDGQGLGTILNDD